jgi:HD-like signal output (HDOD) protein
LTGIYSHGTLSIENESYGDRMSIIQRLSEIHELPTLPEISLRIQSVINSDESNALMLSRIIEQDPSLSAKILKVANSSFYSSPSHKITSVQMAVTRLGFNEVGHIALAVSFIKKFNKKSNILDYKQFWRHSLSAAFLTSMAAETSNIEFSPKEQQSFFLAGLLHDIGILIYDQFFHESFENVINYAIKKEISFIEAEKEISPIETHNMIGSALLELWKIDLPVISGIRYHHHPEKSPNQFQPISSATYLSEYILCNSFLGTFEGTIYNGNKDIISKLQITPESMNNYLRLVEYEVEKSDLVLALENDNSTFQLRGV